MAFRFKRSDKSVTAGFRRIATEDLDKAIAEAQDPGADLAEAVHNVRKRCKKLRGLYRLVGPAFPDYKQENGAIRDAAAKLAGTRDLDAMLESYDKLMAHYDAQIDRTAFASIRQRLTLRRKEMESAEDTPSLLAGFASDLETVRARAGRWKLDEKGFKAIAGGLEKTARRAQKVMKRGRKNGRPEAFHEWRKHTKYHWMHARLLSPIWPELLDVHADAAKELAESLGDHHDLAVMDATLRDAPADFGSSKNVEAARALIAKRMTALETLALSKGALLFAEPADTLVTRWGLYWDAWHATHRATA